MFFYELPGLSVSFSSKISIRINTAHFFSSGAKNKELKKLFGTLNKDGGEQAIQINDNVLHGLGLKQSKLQ